jgi:hypothetical protein
MNFLAALLLVWLPAEDAAYGALVVLMRGRGLRALYAADLAMLQALPGATRRRQLVYEA